MFESYRKENIPFVTVLGYLFSYSLFTTILFFILTFTNKLPSTWQIYHVALITLTVVLLGRLVKWSLK